MVQHSLPSPQNSLNAFADDMAFFSQDLYRSLPVLLFLLVTTARVTGLILNIPKCVIIFYRNHIDRVEEIRRFKEHGLKVRKFDPESCSKVEFMSWMFAP